MVCPYCNGLVRGPIETCNSYHIDTAKLLVGDWLATGKKQTIRLAIAASKHAKCDLIQAIAKAIEDSPTLPKRTSK